MCDNFNQSRGFNAISLFVKMRISAFFVCRKKLNCACYKKERFGFLLQSEAFMADHNVHITKIEREKQGLEIFIQLK